MATRALILFAHGARDARWAAPFERLREMLRGQLHGIAVELAFLELMSPRLPELVQTLAAQGCDDVTLVPVFFGQGGHVLRDLPPMVEALRQTYPAIRFQVANAVGEEASVLQAIAAYCMSSLDNPHA
ncbi:CbiX/SirB N-terminal domain-containing protein [Janthinobacterium sp. 17J80-10]|uniref:sirohydrochlorin chelatase n=1 Tax=Janthinobacterium sp. 17J80-10 TaxID=2497863 RepID=UPI0010057C08|nr:CbiX/SirB N-terminal domain-containing protein [Janthinobacterium sp. 17J80-10]QAU34161.1 cobalamin biosynthesis protein CbiX [Janthinobacterium sp. 17J80-10]